MFLREQEDLVIKQVPITSILADGDNSDQNPRRSSKVGSLTMLVVSEEGDGLKMPNDVTDLPRLLLEHK